MPCRPPIAFCRTVGQAIFHTADAIGPSTIDRSKAWRFLPDTDASGGPCSIGARAATESVGAAAAAGISVDTREANHNRPVRQRMDLIVRRTSAWAITTAG